MKTVLWVMNLFFFFFLHFLKHVYRVRQAKSCKKNVKLNRDYFLLRLSCMSASEMFSKMLLVLTTSSRFTALNQYVSLTHSDQCFNETRFSNHSYFDNYVYNYNYTHYRYYEIDHVCSLTSNPGFSQSDLNKSFNIAPWHSQTLAEGLQVFFWTELHNGIPDIPQIWSEISDQLQVIFSCLGKHVAKRIFVPTASI